MHRRRRFGAISLLATPPAIRFSLYNLKYHLSSFLHRPLSGDVPTRTAMRTDLASLYLPCFHSLSRPYRFRTEPASFYPISPLPLATLYRKTGGGGRAVASFLRFLTRHSLAHRRPGKGGPLPQHQSRITPGALLTPLSPTLTESLPLSSLAATLTGKGGGGGGIIVNKASSKDACPERPAGPERPLVGETGGVYIAVRAGWLDTARAIEFLRKKYLS